MARPDQNGDGSRRKLGVVMPFWLDRPDEEVNAIALAAEQAGIETVWIGEMASFDAFALATAIGLQADGIRLKIGPLPVSVRSPVAIALGVASVVTLTGCAVDVALGASSPEIVSGWHDRPWRALAPRMAETVAALRAIMDGLRADIDGEHVRTHGFKLRRPQQGATISVAAFGPASRAAACGLGSGCADPRGAELCAARGSARRVPRGARLR